MNSLALEVPDRAKYADCSRGIGKPNPPSGISNAHTIEAHQKKQPIYFMQ